MAQRSHVILDLFEVVLQLIREFAAIATGMKCHVLRTISILEDLIPRFWRHLGQ
jgi:hypothetical protein